MKKQTNILGILGGLGPMSTFCFCELLTAHTKANCDSDHIDMIISSRASTPDRTAFILGRSQNNPLPVMQEEAKKLENAGAEMLVIPCNTAHYFYDGLKSAVNIPMLNIIEETVRYLKNQGIQKFGLLATEGTVSSKAYLAPAEVMGLVCITPNDNGQALISSIIYDYIKQNKPVPENLLSPVLAQLKKQGCECIVLGCTELSLLPKSLFKGFSLVDSLEVLAHASILACGHEPIGFDLIQTEA